MGANRSKKASIQTAVEAVAAMAEVWQRLDDKRRLTVGKFEMKVEVLNVRFN